MNFSTFLLRGPSMNSGLYDCYSYIPEEQDVFIRNLESLNIAALRLPPNNFDTNKVIDTWETFDKKTNYLKNSLYVIPFAIVPIMFTIAIIPCIAVIITTIALTTLGFYRSYQAGLQARAWPRVNIMINQTRLALLKVSVNEEFKKCADYLAALNRNNIQDFISDFFDEEKNPLVKTQSQGIVVEKANEVFLFYPRLKVDYNNFIEQSADSITAEQLAENIEIFIEGYIAKDPTKLKSAFPDIITEPSDQDFSTRNTCRVS